ncbi:MAG: HEAT repeat domain-containing protein [Anaerolineae bacterium]|nr:HEAT repeat domain-containing protein [Anaerolineae bacterium]
MSETLTWLHLSDLHAGKPRHAWDMRRIIDTLVDDLRHLQCEHDLHPDFIFFTGDAAFGQVGSGKGESLGDQFAEANSFLESVRKAFRPAVRRSRVFLVPGNHDVNRMLTDKGQTDWLDRQGNPHEIDALLERCDIQWNRYMERLEAYSAFLSDHGYNHLLTDRDWLIFGLVRKLGKKKVGIAGFNTAWSCCRDSQEERGRLWMGSHWQMERLSHKIRQADIKIALMHHPPSWLVEAEDTRFSPDLERDFDFILHGHEHKNWILESVDGSVRIAAGACYERSDKENGYNIVRLDFERGQGEAWLREYDSDGGGWRERLIYKKTNNDGVWFLRHGRYTRHGEIEPSLAASAKLKDVEPDWDRIRRQYYRYLAKELKEHLIRGFAPQVGGKLLSLPISRIFMPLSAVEGRPALAQYSEEDTRIEPPGKTAATHDLLLQQEEFGRRYAQLAAEHAVQHRLTLADLLREPRVVLLGDPGAGKTTTTRYIAYALAVGDMTHLGGAVRNRVPVLIRLANYAKAFDQDRTLHLIDYAGREPTPDSDFGRFIQRAIKDGRCLIILDGLDEVASADLRSSITDRIHQMAAAYSDNHFLITSRIVGYDRSPLTREFTHATLAELGSQERERFIQLWYAALETQSDGMRLNTAEDLIEELRAKPQFARMAANPLLLTVTILMYCRGHKLPTRRVQVYQTATETLAEYWMVGRGRTDIDAEEIKAILAPIARRILEGNVAGVIGEADLLPLLSDGIAEWHGIPRKQAEQSARELLPILSEQIGLFLVRGIDVRDRPVYGFLHQTFGEYLAALSLATDLQSGELELERYIHRSVWHEPLLLMAGHLSLTLNTRSLANDLLSAILDHCAPYDDVLQQNTLLAADILADDLHVAAVLRDDILLRLSRLLEHDAPQVRDAALERFARLGRTHHCDAAITALHKLYRSKLKREAEGTDDLWFNLATALIHLKDWDTARPVLGRLLGEGAILSGYWFKAQRLRFKSWQSGAIDHLQSLWHNMDFPLTIVPADNLEESLLGPVDAAQVKQLVGQEGLVTAIQTLLNLVTPSERVALHWIAAIAQEPVSRLELDTFLSSDVPARIRRLAASRLLAGGEREKAPETLRRLVETEPAEALDSVRLLLERGETDRLNCRLLYDISMIADAADAPTAIATLFTLGEDEIALPAALHLLTFRLPDSYTRPEPLWSVASSLIEHPRFRHLGLAAARWLALRPGYSQRLDTCEALLDHRKVDEAIPLFEYLSRECHNQAGTTACEHLLRLKQYDLAAPVLSIMVDHGPPHLRYQACLALSQTRWRLPDIDGDTPSRIELKTSICDRRTRAYQDAQNFFCDAGLEALDTIQPDESLACAAHSLGNLSLHWLRGLSKPVLQGADWSRVSNSDWPVMCLNAALFEMRVGNFSLAHERLAALLRDRAHRLPFPALKQAKVLLGRTVGTQTSVILVDAICDQDLALRDFAINALESLSDARVVPHLTNILATGDALTRQHAVQVLGSMDPHNTIDVLISALRDEDDAVRDEAISSLCKVVTPEIVDRLAPLLQCPPSQSGQYAIEVVACVNDARIVSLLASMLEHRGDMAWRATEILARLNYPEVVPFLLAALDHEDRRVRRTAAQALGQLRASEALALLISALDDPEYTVSEAAAEALGKLGDRAAEDALASLLNNGGRRQRVAAATALGRLGEKSSIPVLTSALADPEEDVQCAAAEALGALGDVSTREPLVRALQRSSSAVQAAALRSLAHLGAMAPVEAIVAKLTDDIPEVRESAVDALGELGTPSVLPNLFDRLSDVDVGVRASVVQVLAHFDGPATTEQLIRMLENQPGRVSSCAAEALAELQDATAITHLVAALRHQESAVRESAMNALVKFDSRSVIACLTSAFEVESEAVREYAVRIIRVLGDVYAVPLLIRALQDKDKRVRQAAAQSLGRLGDAGAIDALVTALGDEDSEVRQSAAKALGDLGSLSAFAPLASLLADGHRGVRAAAASALGEMGKSPVAAALLLPLTRDPDAAVRVSAILALGKIDNGSTVLPLLTALSDPEGDVRAMAARALGKLRVKAAAPSIASSSVAFSEYQAQAYLEALAQLQPELTPPLRQRYARQFGHPGWVGMKPLESSIG